MVKSRIDHCGWECTYSRVLELKEVVCCCLHPSFGSMEVQKSFPVVSFL